MHTELNTIILTGRPGSGKGTQGKLLAERKGWIHFSTGEQFKLLREEESELGKRVRAIYDLGALLPDWFATYLFEKTLLTISPDTGIVCEGYPRTLTQAHEFVEIVTWLGRPYKLIELNVSDEEVTTRMLKRAEVEHRPDSTTEEQIKTRLAAYHVQTAPVLEFFKEQDRLVSVDGTGSVEDIAAAVEGTLT